MLENLNQKINMKPIDQVKQQYIEKQSRKQKQYEKYVKEGVELNERQMVEMEKTHNVVENKETKENWKANCNRPYRKNVEQRVPLQREYKQNKLHGLQNKIQTLDDHLSRITSQQEVQVKKLEQNFIDKDLYQLLADDESNAKYAHYEQTPIDKQQQDMNKFKRVFINPQQHKLNYINQQKQKIIDGMNQGARVQYDKLLQIHVEEKQSSHQQDIQYMLQESNKEEINDKYQQIGNTSHFFHEQIENAPPSLPNATIASPLTPGNGWAPSIPYLGEQNEAVNNQRDLLIKLRAGQQAGDIQKEGHLSFLLGQLSQNNKQYQQAIKYYNNYSRCANLQKDKVGLALAFNRIGFNYFRLQEWQESEHFHRESQRLSEQHYLFAAGYNLGILLRKQNKIQQALQTFQDSYVQAQQLHHLWSVCLALGQLGITSMALCPPDTEQAYQYLNKCLNLAQQLNNQPIIMDCLFQLSRIQHPSLPHSYNIEQSLKQAIKIHDNKITQISLCNLGIQQGNQQLEQLKTNFDDTF